MTPEQQVTDDAPARLWTLRRGSEEIACQGRLTPHGIEVDLLTGGRVTVTRAFATEDEALNWARDKRERREREGWCAVTAAVPSDQRPVA
jgi:hypothetical protein